MRICFTQCRLRSLDGLHSALVDTSASNSCSPAIRLTSQLHSIEERAFEDPHQFSEGVVHALVNGVFAIRDEHFLGVLAGEAIRAPWEHAGG